MKIAAGLADQGFVVGNTYDKYGSQNPIVRLIMSRYKAALNDLVEKVNPETIHEVGCGEGYWVLCWRGNGLKARGTDFSSQVIKIARANAAHDLPQDVFQVRCVYDVQAGRDSADLIVCNEVFEHLEEPRRAFEALQRIVTGHLIISVPREPIWRLLNMTRSKYIADLGNTPGHLQHWSRRTFTALASEYFDVLEVRIPLPWTMLLCRSKAKR